MKPSVHSISRESEHYYLSHHWPPQYLSKSASTRIQAQPFPGYFSRILSAEWQFCLSLKTKKNVGLGIRRHCFSEHLDHLWAEWKLLSHLSDSFLSLCLLPLLTCISTFLQQGIASFSGYHRTSILEIVWFWAINSKETAVKDKHSLWQRTMEMSTQLFGAVDLVWPV